MESASNQRRETCEYRMKRRIATFCINRKQGHWLVKERPFTKNRFFLWLNCLCILRTHSQSYRHWCRCEMRVSSGWNVTLSTPLRFWSFQKEQTQCLLSCKLPIPLSRKFVFCQNSFHPSKPQMILKMIFGRLCAIPKRHTCPWCHVWLYAKAKILSAFVCRTFNAGDLVLFIGKEKQTQDLRHLEMQRTGGKLIRG